jgi:hypothetical protein
VIDTTGPVITSTYLPPPNSAGWNNTPVTVSFTCTDAASTVASCPDPVTFNSEGINQTVSVTATDVAGNQTTVVVGASIDWMPPLVDLSSPENDSETFSEALPVTGSAPDALSGLSTVLCNGIAATIVDVDLSCTLTLGPGRNTVLVTAVDAAGNAGSASATVRLHVTPQALTVTPVQRRLIVGERSALRAFDDLGDEPADLEWSSSNPSVATVDANGVLMGVSTGETTITAVADSLAGESSVSVVTSGNLSAGDIRWLSTWGGDFQFETMVGIHGDDSAVMASLDSLYDAVGNRMVVSRGLTLSGEQTWVEYAPIASDEQIVRAIADVKGGLIVLVSPDLGFTDERSIVRFSPGAAGPSWRYPLHNPVTEMAQSPDGTIFFITGGAGDAEMAVVALDDATGTMKFRFDRPFPGYFHNKVCQSNTDTNVARTSEFSQLKVDADGVANVMFTASQQDSIYLCGDDSDVVSVQVLLYRISSSGALDVISLLNESFDRYVDANPQSRVRQVSEVPDAEGGVLAAWERCPYVTVDTNCNSWGRYITGNSSGTDFGLSAFPSKPASGSDHVVYALNLQDGGRVSKMDMTTGQVEWTSTVGGVSLAILEDNQVAVSYAQGATTTILGADGMTVATGQPAFSTYMGYSPLEFAGADWIAPYPMALAGVAAYINPEAGYAFSSGGDQWLGGRAKKTDRGIFGKGHVIVGTFGVYRHASIRITPQDNGFWSRWNPYALEPQSATDQHPDGTVTIGAQGTQGVPLCGGKLVSDFNRDADLNQPPATNADGSQDFEHLTYPTLNEEMLIKTLVTLNHNFHQNELDYECRPDEGEEEYNSNSFAAGLLNAARLPAPAFPLVDISNYPGWIQPVPVGAFEP